MRVTHCVYRWLFSLMLMSSPCMTTAQTEIEENEVQHFVLDIRERRVQYDSKVIRVTQGQSVKLLWTTDESVQLHLHGYDIEFSIEPGKPTARQFKAHATGRFPITSHGFSDQHDHDTLLYFEVHPD